MSPVDQARLDGAFRLLERTSCLHANGQLIQNDGQEFMIRIRTRPGIRFGSFAVTQDFIIRTAAFGSKSVFEDP